MSDRELLYHLGTIAANIPDRRERIATAAMAGLLAKYGIDDSDGEMLDEAVKYADGLIKRLDKEVQP